MVNKLKDPYKIEKYIHWVSKLSLLSETAPFVSLIFP